MNISVVIREVAIHLKGIIEKYILDNTNGNLVKIVGTLLENITNYPVDKTSNQVILAMVETHD